MLTSHCGLCSKTEKLLKCSRCKVMLYCSSKHQAADRDAHKFACNAIARSKRLLDTQEQVLRENPDWDDIFTNQAGHFWGILETRPYITTRCALLQDMAKVKTYKSVQTQLEHVMDILRLSHSDNMGMRDVAPAMMLRLNQDQECYDFLKGWALVGDDDTVDEWEHMDGLYMPFKNADVFESIEYLAGQPIGLSQSVALILLKIKLLLDLTELRDSNILRKKVPQEILIIIQDYIPRSSIIAGNRALMERNNDAVIKELMFQVNWLYISTDGANEYFWPSLLQPDYNLHTLPEAYSQGSVQEMQLVLEYSYESWVETEGAIDFIKEKVKEGLTFGGIQRCDC